MAGSLTAWSLNLVPLSEPRSITVTAPSFSTLNMQWRFDTLGSVTFTDAPDPEPTMMLSSSLVDSVTEPSGLVMWRVIAVFLAMGDVLQVRLCCLMILRGSRRTSGARG